MHLHIARAKNKSLSDIKLLFNLGGPAIQYLRASKPLRCLTGLMFRCKLEQFFS